MKHTCSSAFCHPSGFGQLHVILHARRALDLQKRPPASDVYPQFTQLGQALATHPVELMVLLKSAVTTAPSTQPSTTSSWPRASLRTDSCLLSADTPATRSTRRSHPERAILAEISAERHFSAHSAYLSSLLNTDHRSSVKTSLWRCVIEGTMAASSRSSKKNLSLAIS